MSAKENSARFCAVELLSEILDRKRPFDEAVARHAGLQVLSERDRNFARLMIMTVLRRLGQIDALLAAMLEKPLHGKGNEVMHALRLGVAQIIWLKTPVHAAVHAMVDTVAEFGHERMKGLVNVVLKRVAGEGESIIAQQDAALLSVPEWLFNAWSQAYGEEAAHKLALPLESPPPLDITVKKDAEIWAEKLGGVVLPTGSVRLTQAGRVDVLAAYADGAWWVQDAAASLPAKLLGDMAGKKVLDLCAAPGGKTAQLAAAGAQVLAVDQSKRRLQLLQENMQRLKLEVEIAESDILRWKPPFTPDAILLDAPCSATGTLRRHPEAAWHKKPEDVTELMGIQRKMLNRVSGWLGKGGRLVYCVCSLQPEEGERQIEHFLSTHPDFRLVPATGVPAECVNEQGMVRTLPSFWADSGGMDGFFAALLEKI
ncbi:MAG TPA: transcription antitermination factor NusB [Rickettsiales bacterium]|nr:transcription antitermination factor NusB [Rickettsiales bacterium]